jgi:O-methyltransferase involved in polyketide biosynthesis
MMNKSKLAEALWFFITRLKAILRGMDHHYSRGPGVRWVDIDLPDVMDLRQQLVPTPEGDYRLLSASVIDVDQWLNSIPADRPTVVVFEGLTMYLHEDEGRRMVDAIVNRFASTGGQLVFDCSGSMVIRLQRFMRPVKNTGSELHWGIDDPKALEARCSGLKLVDLWPILTLMAPRRFYALAIRATAVLLVAINCSRNVFRVQFKGL